MADKTDEVRESIEGADSQESASSGPESEASAPEESEDDEEQTTDGSEPLLTLDQDGEVVEDED